MKKLKRILALFTVGIFLLALTACGSTVSPTVLYNENGIKITSVRYSTTSNALGPQLTKIYYFASTNPKRHTIS